MRALTQSLVLYVYLIFGQYYNGKVLRFMFGAWLYHIFFDLSTHLSPWQVIALIGSFLCEPTQFSKGSLETFSYSSSSFSENPWFYWGFWVFLCTLREAFLAIFSQSSRRFLAFFKNFREIFCAFLNSWVTIRDNLIAYGGVLKWPKRSVLKTERSLIATRGFNSLHLRHMPWNVMFQGFFCL